MSSQSATASADVKELLSLDVAIVGGGIAGLVTAIQLRRAGHKVTVYEQSQFSNEVGAAIHLAPNSTRILLQLGFDPQRANCVRNDISTLMDGKTRQKLTWTPLDHIPKLYGWPWFLIHRVDLHNELKRLAFGPDGSGIPGVLRTSSRVTGVDCEFPTLTFVDGTIVTPDIVIGADGVHTVLLQSVAGSESVAKPTGFAAYRWLVRMETLQNDADCKWLVDDPRTLMVTFTSDDKKRLAVYPCRNKTLMNFVAIHPEKLGEEGKEDWNISANLQGLLEEYAHFHPEVLSFCKHAEDLNDLKLWRLLYRSPIRPWTKSFVCLVGDAVHPMLPHQGQGGGMALEDGASLGVLLSGLTSKSEIPARFELFQKIRFDRTSATQILSNAGFDEVDSIQEEAARYVNSVQMPKNQQEIHKFFFSYDVVQDSRDQLEALLMETPSLRQAISSLG
ncbi:putative salicylate hydroxylase [Xylariales sp. AK1849]|nr:putative salicylate hydroxylase [Xylariales sp. AK1849]